MAKRERATAARQLSLQKIPWYQQTWGVICAIVAGLGVVVSLILGVSQIIKDAQPEPLKQTEILTFDPSGSAVDDDAYVDSLCAGQSIASARTDAHLCVFFSAVVDPCFEVDDMRYVCPRYPGDAGTRVRPAETRRFYFETDKSLSFSLDTAADQKYPWGIELQMPLDGEMQQAGCRLLLADKAEFQRPEYACAAGGSPTGITLAGEDFVDGTNLTVISVETGPIAIDFDRSKEVWTVKVKTDAGWERFPIERAWF